VSSATPPPPSHAGKVVPRTAAGEEEAGREEGGAVGGAGTWYKGRGALKVQFGPHTEERWVGGEGAHGCFMVSAHPPLCVWQATCLALCQYIVN